MSKAVADKGCEEGNGRARGRAARPAPEKAQPPVSSGKLFAAIGGGLLLAGLAGTLLSARRRQRPPNPVARLASYGAGCLAASVLADSAMEHYGANYFNRAMYVAPLAAAATLGAALSQSSSPAAERIRGAIFTGAILTGAAGAGFHIYNIANQPGGISFNNLFYRAPYGAPAALSLAGIVGLGALAADREGALALRERRDAGVALAAATAGGLFGVTTEIALLHFRGAFHNPLMYAPVAAVPLTGAVVVAATLDPTSARLATARRALGLTTALGLIGTGLHAYGVSRNMGGFRNWTQNLFQGPPIAAPPSLAGLALAGFAALRLLERPRQEEIT